MNEEVRNKKTSEFKEKVGQQEHNIIDGKIVIKNLNEFIVLHEEINKIIDEYNEMTNENSDSRYKKELDSYLKEELDYLDLIGQLMSTLTHCHDVVGLVDSYIISKEWEDVCTLITFNNLKKSLERYRQLREKYPNEKKYETMEQDFRAKYENILKKASLAESAMLLRAEMEENTRENGTSKQKDITLDKEQLEKMPLFEAIVYVENIMKNIRNLRGQKERINYYGRTIKIVKLYSKRFLEYDAILKNLYLKLEEEEDRVHKFEQELSAKLCVDQNLDTEIKEIGNAIETLTQKFYSIEYKNEQVISINYFGGPCVILLKDKEKFQKLYARERELRMKQLLNSFMVEHEFEKLNSDEKKQTILKEIKVIKNCQISGNVELSNLNIIAFIVKYCELETREEYKSIDAITKILKDQGFTKKEAITLSDQAFDYMKLPKIRKEATEEVKEEHENEGRVDPLLNLSNELDRLTDSIYNLFQKTYQNVYNEEDLIKIDYFGDRYLILKSDKAIFDKLYNRQVKIRKQLGVMVYLDDDVKDQKQNILEQIKFLKEYGVENKILAVHMNFLLSEYCMLDKRKKSVSLGTLVRLLEDQGYSENDALYFADNAYEFMKISQNKRVSNTQKVNLAHQLKKVFKNVVKSEEPEKEEINVDVLKEKNNPVHQFISQTVDKMNSHISTFLASLPRKNHRYISKVKKVKKADNREKIKTSVKKKAIIISSALGLSAILGIGLVAGVHRKKLKSETQNNKIEVETNVNDLSLNHSTLSQKAGVSVTIDHFLKNQMEAEIQEAIKNSVDDIVPNPSIAPSEIKPVDDNTTPDYEDNIFEPEDLNIEETGDVLTNIGMNNVVLSAGKAGVQSIDPVQEEQMAEDIGAIAYNMSNSIENENTFTLKNDASIYTTATNAEQEVNKLKPKYRTDTTRDITGYGYNYNGRIIILDPADPDFEAKKVALESNGATLSIVRAENNVDSEGIEGFYNIKDIEMGGRTR